VEKIEGALTLTTRFTYQDLTGASRENIDMETLP